VPNDTKLIRIIFAEILCFRARIVPPKKSQDTGSKCVKVFQTFRANVWGHESCFRFQSGRESVSKKPDLLPKPSGFLPTPCV
jgi:hypothetical protein